MPLRKTRTPRRRGPSPIWILLDRYLVVVSAGLVVGVWIASDVIGFSLSQGTQAALGAFVGYALLKSKADNRWREVELQNGQMQSMVDALDRAVPGSPEALEVRKQLVALSRRPHAGDGGDP